MEPAPAGEKAADPKGEEDKQKEAEENKTENALMKEAESFTRRLKGESTGNLWEMVQKGDDDALKATGLCAETIETLKAERGNLKGLHSILANEKLGKEVLKQLVAYGGSSKFAKSIADEAKAKEKAETTAPAKRKKPNAIATRRNNPSPGTAAVFLRLVGPGAGPQ